LQEANEQTAEPPICQQMEYMQVKTPFIEKWEKEMEEMFTNSELKADTFSTWDNHDELISIDYNLPLTTISKELPISVNNNNSVLPNIVNNINNNTKKTY